IAAAFRRLGFAVKSYQNLGLIELGRALGDFGRTNASSEISVVYFAGHGLEIDGHNYLVPVDAELEHVGRVPFEAIPLEKALIAVVGAELWRLVILDACRDNPFLGRMHSRESTRSFGLGAPLKLEPSGKLEPGANMLVAYAAKHGTKALDGLPQDG